MSNWGQEPEPRVKAVPFSALSAASDADRIMNQQVMEHDEPIFCKRFCTKDNARRWAALRVIFFFGLSVVSYRMVQGMSGWGVELTTHLYRGPKFRTVVTTPVPAMPSWCAEVQLRLPYLSQTCGRCLKTRPLLSSVQQNDGVQKF